MRCNSPCKIHGESYEPYRIKLLHLEQKILIRKYRSN